MSDLDKVEYSKKKLNFYKEENGYSVAINRSMVFNELSPQQLAEIGILMVLLAVESGSADISTAHVAKLIDETCHAKVPKQELIFVLQDIVDAI